ncbi:PREDICTED: maternal protein tudor isoform X1 [Rhagoletis zephyria]|uniref:maternal protein tudor isoform X1 n=1 Tax=Rhagoletis zephyria TaxID=28612 RepID=UPI0008119B49|nr:PREDICTED: maternal protein tudor isoform X1 [Rhagoletis zephyria]XP_017476604.1 PREDICTED: maternal protein tudor isoform X1 [Rhagoletis zephyria]
MSSVSSAATQSAASTMGTDSTKRLQITHVDAFGPYLRIYGQMNADAMAGVRNKIQQLLHTCLAIDPTWPVQRQLVPLHIGTMCLYKSTKGSAPVDFEFVRVRIQDVITNIGQGQKPLVKVEVEFVDYGGKALVASYELLFPEQQDALSSMPTICAPYILLGICKDFKPAELEEISRIIMRQTLEISIEFEFKQYKFITMKWKEFNFAEFLIHQKKIGAPIANELLRDNFTKFVKQQIQKPQQPIKSAIPPQPQKSHHLAAAQQQQQLQKQTMQMYAAAASNVNNNNYYAINHNNNVAPVGGVYPAVGRSLTSRLQQFQLQQQPAHLALPPHLMMNIQRPIQPRMPHTIGNLRSLYVPYATSNYQQHNSYNGFPQPAAASISGGPYATTYTTRYQRPQPQQQPLDISLSSDSSNQSLKTSPRRATTATFKTNNLTVGKTYDVYVSFVENGPCLFSVQLAKVQDNLTEMMNRIERVQLKQFSDKPILGTACIARYSEDGQLYRALITGVQPTACKVVYIDYGNAELVKYKDLYEIPDEFLEAKAFAIRFTLSGHKDLEPIDESLKKAFKDLMMYKNCQLKVMPLEGPPLVQYCELYLQQQNNVLDVLKEIQKCRLVYPKSENLNNNDIVEIRYIDSPKHFYVQKVDNIVKFEKLMDDMYLYYNKNQVVPNHLALGAPCIVKYDNEWYRAEVMRADSTAIIVRHVDFGYEQKVTKNLLSTIAEKHLKLPRQAVQCCLKGFENNELNKDLATNQFEMLAEESNRQRRSFTVKVFRIQPDGVHLVNLCTKDLNVMKKLYKLSMPFEQYLTLEKEEFNIHPHNGHQNRYVAAGQENGNKTPSIASSNDAASLHLNKKGVQILNSTMQSDEHQQQKAQQLQQVRKSSPRNLNSRVGSTASSAPPSSIQGTLSVEWDKQSSASSMDNRDSRSSSSELKQGKRQAQQRQGRNAQTQQNNLNISNTSSGGDRRSVGSAASSAASFNHKPRGGGHQIPPRFQNENRRQKKEQQAPVTPPRQQRPQNAPQGYSQQRNKTATNATTTSSQRSNDAASEVASNASEPLSTQLPEEYVPLNQPFPVQHLDTPSREEVSICWWISPHQFYTHLKSRLPEFERLMRDMQQFYKKKSLQQLQLKVGSFVIARYRKENLLYRARILACNQMLRKYKVHFVDFGNQYTVTSEDIWQVERRFSTFPVMAHLCSFSGIVSNYDHLYIIDRMEKYLPAGATLNCEYIERELDMYYVNVKLNGVSLKDTLKSEGIITEVAPDLRISLLAGQQIRVKITYVKDMLNFKIHVEGLPDDVQLLSSYDDVRYVKSNPDVAFKFKQFYEGKSWVVNIKDVNDNKVILLRPLVPLLKNDVSTFICQPPILLERFEGRVVHVVNAYRVFVHAIASEEKMTELLNEMYEYYENNGTPLTEYEPEEICAALGSDGNWYRARITPQSTKDAIEVRYIDYGNTETLDETKLKRLEEKFFINCNAFAIELNLPVRTLIADAQHKGSKSKKTTNVSADADAAAAEKLKELTLEGEPVLNVKALEVQNNHLIAELTLPNGDNVVDTLLQMQLIKSRDLDFMRKHLEKDNTNMFEYIELVDLTIEEEEDSEKKIVGKSKNSSSPKKKKQAKTDEKYEKAELQANKKEKIPKQAEVVGAKEVEKQTVAVEAPIIMAETPPQTPPQAEIQAEKAENDTAAAALASPAPSPIPPATTNTSEPQSVAESETESVDPYADMEHAVLSHCDNPGQFFVHPYDKLDELHKLQENLQIVASSLPPLMSVVNNAHCISLYSVDKQWYRAKILDAELMVLKFIDFGNTDCVSDTTDVKEMSVFPDIEPLCMPCSLPIKPNGTADWVDAANAIFNDSYSKLLNFEYITRGDTYKRSFIHLYIDGVNIADRLVEDGFAKHLELVDSGENCYISHVNNISDFYIQYEKDSKALELIEIYLAENEKLKKLGKFEYAKIVAALFPDDEMWYRAKLLKQVPNKGYEVLFIDYGNTSISVECREISEEIANLPPLSKKCALQLSEHCLAWSDAAEEKFSEIAAQGETIFTVELREPAAEHALVHLLIDGHNINADLEPLCEQKPAEIELNMSFSTTIQSSVFESGKIYDALVSHANSPTDFYVQFSKDAIRLDDMTSSLNALGMDALKTPQVGQLCATVYSEDNTLYRARILETIAESGNKQQYRLIFIDFGNEAITDDVRILPHDLQALPEFARHCQLAGVAEEIGENKAQLSIDAFSQLVEECEGVVKIEFVESRQPTTPAQVKLYTASGDEDLGERLHVLIASISANATAAVVTPQIADNTCIISHAISPTHFYIQPKINSLHMELVTKTLTKSDAEQLAVLESIEVGGVCSAYCAEDDCYYRGRVQKVLAGDGGYEIFLVDYGNSINTTLIREIPEDLYAVPSLAWKCKLNAVPEAPETLLNECFAALLEAHFGEIYEIESDETAPDASERVHTVKLQANYKDLAEELAEAVAKGDAEEAAAALSPVPTLYSCNIIHVNSPASFYIQLAEDVPAVEKITDVLLDAETDFQPFTDLQVGALCAAQFPDDMAFYRAEIVQVLDEGKCEVHYLDFGNNSVTDQFRALPEDILHTEPFSKHCALDVNIAGNVDACMVFAQFIDSRFSETFQVEFLKTTVEPKICRLFYQEKNVANEVLQLVKSGASDDSTLLNGVGDGDVTLRDKAENVAADVAGSVGDGAIAQ